MHNAQKEIVERIVEREVVREGSEICSRPTIPPQNEASKAASPPTLSYREPQLVRRVVV